MVHTGNILEKSYSSNGFSCVNMMQDELNIIIWGCNMTKEIEH